MSDSTGQGPLDTPVAGPPRVAVVIPAFRVETSILGVVAATGPTVTAIYVVDDACPNGSGQLAVDQSRDPRVKVLFRDTNGGVGAAVKTGYRAALADGMDVVVKVDGDGQMDPGLIRQFVRPISRGLADYTKGNRFFNPEDVAQMPRGRLLANAVLSFASKLSSGYWYSFDPSNGFTAIHASVLRRLPLDKIANRYFFESDMLFRLGTIRATVVDIPMTARYGSARSSLTFRDVAVPFMVGHLRSFIKRIFYGYFLRGFSIASLELLVGIPLLAFGVIFGAVAWMRSVETGVVATSGEVMLAALPVLVGIQLLLAFLQFDIASTPSVPLHPLLDVPDDPDGE